MSREIHNPFIDSGREVIIAEAVRTPIGRANAEKGWYRDVHPNAMLAATYTELLQRSGVAPEAIEDLIIGCTAPFGEQSRNVGRNAWLQAGYPPEVPAMQVDRRCGSAQTAAAIGAAFVASGMHELVIAGGVENMGHIPMNAQDKLVEQYGSRVLALPKDKGFGRAAYLVPIALVALMLIALAIFLPRWRRNRDDEGPSNEGPTLTDADARRLDEDLARYDV